MNEIANQKSTDNNQVFGFIKKLDKINKFSKSTSFINSAKFISFNNSNKRRLRAEGFLLLPSALRPRLFKYNNKKITNNIALTLILFMAINTIGVVEGILGPMNKAFAEIPVAADSDSGSSTTSITLTIPSSFSIDITPSTNGTFVKSDSKSINVKTDNSSGYTLSIKAKNSENSNSLINGNNSINNKLNSISEQTSEDNFKSDSKFNNTWGYLPSKFNSKDNANFLPGPTNEESILETTEEANEAGTDYNITLGAKIDNTMSSGSYNNNFVFSAIANEPKVKYMQNFTAEDCAALTQDDGSNGSSIVTTLVDNRDGNEYKVAKLKDGKCWMVQGLRIVDKTIDSTDSDMTSGSFTIPVSNRSKFVSSDNNNDAAYYNNDQDDGAYYTWHTATAGTGTSSTGANVDATSSICPKGWKLPKGGAEGSATSDFVTLVKAYGGTGNNGSDATTRDKLIASPVPHFTYAGSVHYSNGTLGGRGSGGIYWSRTAHSTTVAYNLYSDNGGNLNPAGSNTKRNGQSVRCVYYPPKKITDLQYMQDWGDLSETEKTQVVNSMQDETTYTLKDQRDNSEYTIAKLKDGKVWMTQNLRLVNKTITSTDSDITSGTYTIPASTSSGWNYGVYTNNKAYYGNNTNYGALYTWLTATAGTGTASMSSEEAPSSICPKGWRLPTYDEMKTLTSTYSYSQAQASPPNFGSSSWAGYCFQGDCPSDQGSFGYWWSSTAYSGNDADAYRLDLYSGYFGTSYSAKGCGFSVRCVGRE